MNPHTASTGTFTDFSGDQLSDQNCQQKHEHSSALCPSLEQAQPHQECLALCLVQAVVYLCVHLFHAGILLACDLLQEVIDALPQLLPNRHPGKMVSLLSHVADSCHPDSFPLAPYNLLEELAASALAAQAKLDLTDRGMAHLSGPKMRLRYTNQLVTTRPTPSSRPPISGSLFTASTRPAAAQMATKEESPMATTAGFSSVASHLACD